MKLPKHYHPKSIIPTSLSLELPTQSHIPRACANTPLSKAINSSPFAHILAAPIRLDKLGRLLAPRSLLLALTPTTITSSPPNSLIDLPTTKQTNYIALNAKTAQIIAPAFLSFSNWPLASPDLTERLHASLYDALYDLLDKERRSAPDRTPLARLVTGSGSFSSVNTPTFYTDQLEIDPARPFAAKFVNIGLIYAFLGKRNAKINDLHLLYGSVVQIAPNELSILHIDAIKSIYVANLDKSDFYNFDNYNTPNAFSIKHRIPHRTARARYQILYSNSNITNNIFPSVSLAVDKLIHSIAVASQDKPSLNVLILFKRLAMRAALAVTLGPSAPQPADAELDAVNEKFSVAFNRWFFTSYAPWVPATSAISNAYSFTDSWLLNLVSSAWTCPAPHSLIQKLKGSGLPKLFVASEAMDHISAGHDTTALALSFLCYEVSSNPQLQADLQRTIESEPSFDHARDIPKDNLCEWCILETLRLHSPIPGSEPRVVGEKGLSILSYYINPGTVVSIQPYSLHRVKRVFGEDADSFNPYRWKDASKEMYNYMMPFGAGSRMCVGQHLALLVMRLTIRKIYGEFSTRVAENASNCDFRPLDRYTTAISSNSCYLQFTKKPTI
ncbi:hypothetical protein CANCADRAFT_1441 [Tortispora caseinolytica NRRL Y-17796]|uniref:Cytochrome P450 n=1 Tax=Tortispora caseinolytica NRRL Y-17796 TaxID=767744 RepID=A0A1E4TM54_9ASCO|nr:hypothetical protein CANCADRAFT_1441 [Tortispora caseinolytica NRRL Y-17796]